MKSSMLRRVAWAALAPVGMVLRGVFGSQA